MGIFLFIIALAVLPYAFVVLLYVLAFAVAIPELIWKGIVIFCRGAMGKE